MSKIDVIRAWKDELYRASLSERELAHLPDHPAGFIELEEEQLANIEGGTSMPCVVSGTIVTDFLSCFPPCDGTIDGTCGLFSIGCCREPVPVEHIPLDP